MTRSHARHRVPPTYPVRRVIVISVLSVLPMALMAPSFADTPNGTLDAIAACESGDKNINNSTFPVSSASGHYQIINATWKRFGGQSFAKRAIEATRTEQTIVAHRIADANPSLSDWNQSRSCWSSKVETAKHSSAKQAPKHAKIDTPKHALDYTVLSGDTLSQIAAMHGKTWQFVYEANRDVVSDPNQIFPGEHIEL